MRKCIYNIILVILILIFIISTISSIVILKRERESLNAYQELAKEVEIEQAITINQNDQENKKEEKIELNTNFNKLLKKNKNISGWIYIPNTKISYPIVQSTKKHGNDYWLDHLTDYTYNINGSIFISELNNVFSDNNTIIYGHNMGTGKKTMFSELLNYTKQNYYKKHKYIYIETVDGVTHKYVIFSIYKTPDASDAYKINFDENEFKEWVDNRISKTIVNCKDIDSTLVEKVITLSTCTGNSKTERLVLHLKEEL